MTWVRASELPAGLPRPAGREYTGHRIGFSPGNRDKNMESLVQPTLDFVAAHRDWAVAIMFVTAFGESLVFLSLAFPGTSLLIAAGTLISDGTLPPLPIIVAAILGATLGDSVSYWVGRRFGTAITAVWPFTRHPELLPSGVRFFQRHGGKSVFVGRFFGPLRAVIPLAAGLMRMPRGWFWFANIASAALWAPLLLFAGDALGAAGERMIGSVNTVALVFGGLVLFGIAGAAWAVVKSARSKR
jgi:membrane protein DedA with SNARE-associated domain